MFDLSSSSKRVQSNNKTVGVDNKDKSMSWTSVSCAISNKQLILVLELEQVAPNKLCCKVEPMWQRFCMSRFKNKFLVINPAKVTYKYGYVMILIKNSLPFLPSLFDGRQSNRFPFACLLLCVEQVSNSFGQVCLELVAKCFTNL